MKRHILEFDKITDVIKTKESNCELYKLNDDHWLKVSINGSEYIFYHVLPKGLFDFLSGKVNMAGLFNNAPGNEFFLYVENKGVKVRDKYSFDYKSISSWDKFYEDFNSLEILDFNIFLKEQNL